ncbi:histidine phosphatase superfamily [Dactylonectria estremocensis]|uniref:Histidine phosphatase superfamily n=1 Tax=Dactylonectria estremocensis TaxID=1079267 RepID=A0A9P9E7J7_9HYPO|nr:histidine phosphatase superfamily [Dactylonectria estremocensis]
MALRKCLAVASTLIAGVWAQSGNQSDVGKVWAVAAFVNNGDRTPIVGETVVLTPEGAQQMLRQGRAFRARYLTTVNDSAYDNVEEARLQDMTIHEIDNSVLDFTSQTDESVTGGAMAFLQGLYPPSPEAFGTDTEETDIARDYTEGGDNITDYPLNGYQYPNLRTLSILDPMSTAIQGNLRCSNWESEMSVNLTNDASMKEFYNATIDYYQIIFSTYPLQGIISLSDANLWNAYEIYDLVSYLYTHNQTVHDGFVNGTAILSILRKYATSMERIKNSYADGSDSAETKRKEILYSVAGRSLANRVARQFINNLQWSGSHDKLTLMFGSFDPIISFIALSGLLTTDSILDGPFSTLPNPGAALIFELVGEDSDNPDLLPSFNDLSVRLLYRASADPDEEFTSYPMFDSESQNGLVPYSTFIETMQEMGVTAYDWCDVCGDTTAPWCLYSFTSEDDLNNPSSSLDPIVAGVVGAVIMGVVVALAAGCLYCFAGVRLRRKAVQDEPNPPVGVVGGFKGPERMDGDKDVAVTKEGFHHERVGSWELKDGKPLPSFDAVGIAPRDVPRERGRSLDDDDDISVMGATPVKAHEAV